MSEANKQPVRRHFEELFNRQHLAAADELVAQEYLEHAVAPFGQAEPGKVNGPTHLRQTAQWLLAQFPDLHGGRSRPRSTHYRRPPGAKSPAGPPAPSPAGHPADQSPPNCIPCPSTGTYTKHGHHDRHEPAGERQR